MFRFIVLLFFLTFCFIACNVKDPFEHVEFEIQQGNKKNALELLKKISRDQQNATVYDSLSNVIYGDIKENKKLF